MLVGHFGELFLMKFKKTNVRLQRNNFCAIFHSYGNFFFYEFLISINLKLAKHNLFHFFYYHLISYKLIDLHNLYWFFDYYINK